MSDNRQRTDSHAHVFVPGLNLSSDRRYAPSYKATVDDFVAQLDEHNMARGVLIQPSFLGFDNSYMLQAIDAYPQRLWGVAVLNPEMITEAQLKELANHNIIGIRLNLYNRPIPDLKSPMWQKCLAFIKALRWHVELHIDAKVLPSLISSLLEANVKVVIDHFGRPMYDTFNEDEGIKYLLECGQTGRIWVKVSGFYRLGKTLEEGQNVAKSLFPRFLEAYGPYRLLWGSDWPHTQFEDKITYDVSYAMFKDMVQDIAIENTILSTAFDELIMID